MFLTKLLNFILISFLHTILFRYETAIKANKFASPSEYKKGWLQNRFRNSFKVHETEGYKLDRAVQKIFSSVGLVILLLFKKNVTDLLYSGYYL